MKGHTPMNTELPGHDLHSFIPETDATLNPLLLQSETLGALRLCGWVSVRLVMLWSLTAKYLIQVFLNMSQQAALNQSPPGHAGHFTLGDWENKHLNHELIFLKKQNQKTNKHTHTNVINN